ncbi:MAG: hypothetical protein HY744_34490 [Deltaproteobacteria bacterium]|nr:hypothetical protein [Deltaproteobacteria bacterium]
MRLPHTARSRQRRAALGAAIWLAGTGAVAGCGDVCDDAVEMCQECELKTDDCLARFEHASEAYCAAAVDAYDAHCGAK